jgi:hypothetical protein
MDTNAPAISRLNSRVIQQLGPTKDDDLLIGSFDKLLMTGTAGHCGRVGAEDKDRTIEAVLPRPEAAPHILKNSRNINIKTVSVYAGINFATLIVALPGPNDEVQLGLEAFAKGLSSHSSKDLLAENIAISLRKRLKEKISSS